MDERRARKLLSEERARVEAELRIAAVPTSDDESSDEVADNATDTYQAEVDEGRVDELRSALASVERAEERLREGTYGLSVESGRAIPDERLEAMPTAERTIEEERVRARGG
jgi:DnaK suppressor protein